MSVKVINTLLFCLLCSGLCAQNQNYIGAGRSQNVTVTSSSNHQLYGGLNTASANKTIDGSGLEGDLMEAARFLSQATFGGTMNEIEDFAAQGNSFETWIDNQLAIPATYTTDSVELFYNMGKANYVANGGNAQNYSSRPSWRHFDYAWWNNTMNAPDQLRQRMAYALSQILVISSQGTLNSYGLAISNYYDLLLEYGFSNFENLLLQVTLSVPMGNYLSHLNNPRTNLAANLFPDENYAREIMQLFSIGIYKLNIDGTLQTDVNGDPIPTYDQNDIKELAKVFTGLSVGQRTDGGSLYFYLGIYNADFSVPMIMYDTYHEPGPKTIIDGHVVPGASGMTDIFNAVDHLFNHQNVGPFLSRQLIQHFVKSNPSPGYVQDVAEVFNDNGSGVRGDLKAVLKEILLHPEARSCTWVNDPQQGKLREPALRFTQFARFFRGFSPHQGGRFWNYGSFFDDRVSQHPLHSPTVFNFFGPDYVPGGPLANANLVGPEFQILNTNTSIGYADMVYYWVESEILFLSYTSDALNSHITDTDLSSLTELAKDMDALLDHFDLVLCNGQMSEHTRKVIKDELNQFLPSTNISSRIKLAIYLIMISPDYVIAK